MKICILKGPLKNENLIDPSSRTYTKHLQRNINIDKMVYLYLKSKNINVDYIPLQNL